MNFVFESKCKWKLFLLLPSKSIEHRTNVKQIATNSIPPSGYCRYYIDSENRRNDSYRNDRMQTLMCSKTFITEPLSLDKLNWNIFVMCKW